MSIDSKSAVVVRDGYRWEPQKCPICEIKPTNFIGVRGGDAHRDGLGVRCEIWSCLKCGLIFPDPMPVPINGLAQHYEVPAGEFFAHHDQQEKFKTACLILEDAERMIGRTGKLLDIGAGRGETLKLALDTGWDAYGIEPSASFAATAQELCGRALYTKPLEECDLPPNEFDVVILSAVLEHLYDPRSVIAEIARVLKSGGVLFLDVPNERGLFFKVGNLYQRFRSREWCINLSPTFPPFHLFGFSPKSLRMLLNAEGLDLTKLFVFGGECVLESRRGILGSIERSAAKLITAASKFGRMGSYIAAWAQKSRDLEP